MDRYFNNYKWTSFSITNPLMHTGTLYSYSRRLIVVFFSHTDTFTLQASLHNSSFKKSNMYLFLRWNHFLPRTSHIHTYFLGNCFQHCLVLIPQISSKAPILPLCTERCANECRLATFQIDLSDLGQHTQAAYV